MPPPEDPIEWITRLAESSRQLRLGPGVTGKTAAATVVLLVIWGIVVWRLDNDLIQDGAIVLSAVIATGAWAWWTKRTHDFAARNPGVALLEGAHFLEYERFSAQGKGISEVRNEASVHESAAPSLPQSDQDELS